jgi:hypothetical protein
MTHRSALFAAVLGLGRAGSNVGDQFVIAAKAVSTVRSVSVPQRSRSSAGLPLEGVRVAVVRPRRFASRFVRLDGC